MYYAYKKGRINREWFEKCLNYSNSPVKNEKITFEEYCLKMFPSAEKDSKRYANFFLEGNLVSYIMQRYLVILYYSPTDTNYYGYVHHPEGPYPVYL
uniref:Uncharacterized protein n=1 Tax=Meloidogyne enterolobii TaxID=390850 RepID=A0A6V7XZ74_MELEN|nr:unnamed protein product [Meloidogyne enterolobii]